MKLAPHTRTVVYYASIILDIHFAQNKYVDVSSYNYMTALEHSTCATEYS